MKKRYPSISIYYWKRIKWYNRQLTANPLIWTLSLAVYLFIAMLSNPVESKTIPVIDNDEKSWHQQRSDTSDKLFSVYFIDCDIGWAVGHRSDEGSLGLILHTKDGGQSWKIQEVLSNIIFRSIHFVNGQQGWTAGWSYTYPNLPSEDSNFFSTDDGGKTWTFIDGRPLIVHDLFFTDVKTGWVAGEGEYPILHTQDGGATWIKQAEEYNRIHSIHFTDAETGWAVGPSSLILHTTDGGENWNQQNLDTTAILETVYFDNSQTGWAAGRNGMILQTTNAGVDWKVQSSGTSNRLFSINFADDKTGWAVGDFGTILHTSDGGESWQLQESGFGKRLHSIHACRSDLAWAAGQEGAILHYRRNPTSIENEDGKGSRQIRLHQNYPNPFNSQTEIAFELPGQEKVRLALYDNLGRKVAVLFDGVKHAGLHQVTIDATGLASGVYLYQLNSGGQTLNRKMLLVK